MGNATTGRGGTHDLGATFRPRGCGFDSCLGLYRLFPSESGTDPSTTTSSTIITTSVQTTRTESTTTGTEPETTTTEATTVDIDVVVFWVQGWMDDQFVRSEPLEGVIGAYQLECRDSEPIGVGGVFACVGRPQTEPGLQLDPAGVVIYVLDESGAAVWSAGTDVPDTTERLLEAYDRAPKELLCRDLMSPEVEAFPFTGVGRPPEDAFFWSLVYWSLEGQPARMDEDGNGIPCETLHDADVVSKVLGGGPVPST